MQSDHINGAYAVACISRGFCRVIHKSQLTVRREVARANGIMVWKFLSRKGCFGSPLGKMNAKPRYNSHVAVTTKPKSDALASKKTGTRRKKLASFVSGGYCLSLNGHIFASLNQLLIVAFTAHFVV